MGRSKTITLKELFYEECEVKTLGKYIDLNYTQTEVLEALKVYEERKLGDKNYLEVMRAVCGNNYTLCFNHPYKQFEKIIYCRIENFNSNGNVVAYEEDKSNLYIIPYRNILWMIPDGLSKQYKEKISKERDSN